MFPTIGNQNPGSIYCPPVPAASPLPNGQIIDGSSTSTILEKVRSLHYCHVMNFLRSPSLAMDTPAEVFQQFETRHPSEGVKMCSMRRPAHGPTRIQIPWPLTSARAQLEQRLSNGYGAAAWECGNLFRANKDLIDSLA